MLLRKMWAVECSVDLAAFSQMPRSAAVPLLKRVWIAERPICSMPPPPSPMPESSQADSRHKKGDQSPDVKSYQVQYYHQTYIIKIMDITAYFLSLLSDWLERGLPLAGFFGGRVGPANRSLSTGIHTGLGHIQRDNGSDYRGIAFAWSDQGYSYLSICQLIFVGHQQLYFLCIVDWGL